MVTSDHNSAAPQHPAPARHRVSVTALCFGLLAAPGAWIFSELLLYFISSRLCTLKNPMASAFLRKGISPWFTIITVAAFLLALIGVWVSLRNWLATREESHGSGHHLAEVGEGRTRFLAMCSMLASIGFAIAFLFIFAQLYTARLC